MKYVKWIKCMNDSAYSEFSLIIQQTTERRLIFRFYLCVNVSVVGDGGGAQLMIYNILGRIHNVI